MLSRLIHLWAVCVSLCSSKDSEIDDLVQQVTESESGQAVLDLGGIEYLRLAPGPIPQQKFLHVSLRQQDENSNHVYRPSDDVLMAVADRLVFAMKLTELVVEDTTTIPFDDANPLSSRFPSLLLLTILSPDKQPRSYYSRFGFEWRPKDRMSIEASAKRMHESPLRLLLPKRRLEQLVRKFPELDVNEPLPQSLRIMLHTNVKQAEEMLSLVRQYGLDLAEEKNVLLTLTRMYLMKKRYEVKNEDRLLNDLDNVPKRA